MAKNDVKTRYDDLIKLIGDEIGQANYTYERYIKGKNDSIRSSDKVLSDKFDRYLDRHFPLGKTKDNRFKGKVKKVNDLLEIGHKVYNKESLLNLGKRLYPDVSKRNTEVSSEEDIEHDLDDIFGSSEASRFGDSEIIKTRFMPERPKVEKKERQKGGFKRFRKKVSNFFYNMPEGLLKANLGSLGIFAGSMLIGGYLGFPAAAMTGIGLMFGALPAATILYYGGKGLYKYIKNRQTKKAQAINDYNFNTVSELANEMTNEKRKSASMTESDSKSIDNEVEQPVATQPEVNEGLIPVEESDVKDETKSVSDERPKIEKSEKDRQIRDLRYQIKALMGETYTNPDRARLANEQLKRICGNLRNLGVDIEDLKVNEINYTEEVSKMLEIKPQMALPEGSKKEVVEEDDIEINLPWGDDIHDDVVPKKENLKENDSYDFMTARFYGLPINTPKKQDEVSKSNNSKAEPSSEIIKEEPTITSDLESDDKKSRGYSFENKSEIKKLRLRIKELSDELKQVGDNQELQELYEYLINNYNDFLEKEITLLTIEKDVNKGKISRSLGAHSLEEKREELRKLGNNIRTIEERLEIEKQEINNDKSQMIG